MPQSDTEDNNEEERVYGRKRRLNGFKTFADFGNDCGNVCMILRHPVVLTYHD